MQKDRFLALFGDYIEEHIRQNLSDGQVLSVVIEREARALDIEEIGRASCRERV